MEDYIQIIRELGFPIAIALILLWDKIKNNGALKIVVENNSKLLNEIKNILMNK